MRTFFAAIGFAGAISLALTPKLSPAAEPAIAPPVQHENLSVYFLRGPSAPGPVPLTLNEALSKGMVVVRETGNVERLEIDNQGQEAVFVQAGDIVKGGKQDRVLTVSLLVPPKSGPTPIGAFCVEQGRWQARGVERVDRFTSSNNYLPSKRAKLALAVNALAPVARAEATPARSSGEPSAQLQTNIVQQRGNHAMPRSRSGQGEVWASVAEAQAKLSANIGEQVAARESRSSLQLALENQQLVGRRQAFKAAIESKAIASDIIGAVFAINGRVVSGEIYPSNGLFRKMWPKLVEAAAIEAISEASSKAGSESARSLTSEEVRAVIEDADKGRAYVTTLNNRLTRDAREGTKAVAISTLASDGKLLHRSYVTK